MYIIELQLASLLSNIENARNDLKDKLTAKGIAYDAADTLRKLISLLPSSIVPPQNLWGPLAYHTAINKDSTNILITGGDLNGSVTSNHKLYDRQTETYTTKQNYPSTTKAHAAANWKGNLMYCGGENQTTKTYFYNWGSNTFTTKTNMPSARSYHTLVATNDYLIVSGGWSGSADLITQMTYDISSNSYSTKNNLLAATDRHAASHTKSNELLINGGNDSNNGQLNYIFNITSKTTTQKVNLPQRRYNHKSIKITDDTSLIVGGVTSKDVTNIEFDSASNSFTNKKSFPVTIEAHTLCKSGDRFLISGGFQDSTRSAKQYIYDKNKDDYFTVE